MENQEAKMKVVKNETQEEKVQTGETQVEYEKPTYEDLHNALIEQYQKVNFLERRLQQMDMTNFFQRLHFLFMVLNNAASFEDKEFVKECAKEIQDKMKLDTEAGEGSEDIGKPAVANKPE